MISKKIQILKLLEDLLSDIEIDNKKVDVYLNRLINTKSSSKNFILIESSNEIISTEDIGFPRMQTRTISASVFCVNTSSVNKIENLDKLSTEVQKKLFKKENYNLNKKVNFITIDSIFTADLSDIGTNTTADRIDLTINYYTLENEIDYQL